MKITKREKTEPKLNKKGLLTGTVFRYKDGVIGLKLERNIALLKETPGNDWFVLATPDGDYGINGNEAVAEILGKITEIIVE